MNLVQSEPEFIWKRSSSLTTAIKPDLSTAGVKTFYILYSSSSLMSSMLITYNSYSSLPSLTFIPPSRSRPPLPTYTFFCINLLFFSLPQCLHTRYPPQLLPHSTQNIKLFTPDFLIIDVITHMCVRSISKQFYWTNICTRYSVGNKIDDF